MLDKFLELCGDDEFRKDIDTGFAIAGGVMVLAVVLMVLGDLV